MPVPPRGVKMGRYPFARLVSASVIWVAPRGNIGVAHEKHRLGERRVGRRLVERGGSSQAGAGGDENEGEESKRLAEHLGSDG